MLLKERQNDRSDEKTKKKMYAGTGWPYRNERIVKIEEEH